MTAKLYLAMSRLTRNIAVLFVRERATILVTYMGAIATLKLQCGSGARVYVRS